MVVAHNLSAMNSQRQFSIVGKRQAKNAEKLSSGYKINRAADDAAGLAISEKMRRQIRGLNQGSNNIQDGISIVQVADGALSEVQDMLHRISELTVKAMNGTNAEEDRSYIQLEVEEIINEVDRIGKTTTFNGMPILMICLAKTRQAVLQGLFRHQRQKLDTLRNQSAWLMEVQHTIYQQLQLILVQLTVRILIS